MSLPATTLNNCDHEPIHIPGSIQPLGCLLAFDANGRLRHYSANAAALLGSLPALGAALAPEHLNLVPEAYQIIADYALEMHDSETLIQTQEVSDGQQVYDLVLHVNKQMLVAEFELRQTPSQNLNLYSVRVQKSNNALKKQKTVDALLQTAADEIRALTGFDRVMAYRFRYDDSGEIAAEAKRDDLDSLNGRRYPASDIPSQARRMYIANTLRLIADVNGDNVTLLSAADTAPLDMSYSVLRSVSPIHIEYMKNMGVAASMSVSIVLNDKLWGMMACHHMTPFQVPYSVRVVCDLMCQVIASSIQNLETRHSATRQIASTNLRASLVLDLVAADDLDTLLFGRIGAFAELIPCDAAFVTYSGKWATLGSLSNELCRDLQAWLNAHAEDFYYVNSVTTAPATLAALLGPYSGMLAINVDQVNRSWLVLLRVEQVHTVRWGGKPEKNYVSGPLGPRLTPRGSFDEWKELVKDHAEPWSAQDLAVARDLQVDLLKVFNAKNAEMDRARTQLMAVLGHDLRDPLHSISMAAQMMELQDGSNRISERIKNSSGRMQRLVSQVMDMTKLHTGLGLGIVQRGTNLSTLLRDLIEEHQIAYPDAPLVEQIDSDLWVELDEDRVAQVISNLISNARHHGDAGQPIHIGLVRAAQAVVLSVSNAGQPIADATVRVLFDPFKRQILANSNNKNGLGLGLYITNEIVKSHGGSVSYRYADDRIVFEVTFPLAASAE